MHFNLHMYGTQLLILQFFSLVYTFVFKSTTTTVYAV